MIYVMTIWIVLIANVSLPTTELYDIIGEYKEILVLDTKLSKLISEISSFLESLMSKSPEYHVLAGSISEGAFSPRLFYQNEEFSNNINNEIELDIEVFMYHLPSKLQPCVREMVGKPGFVTIQGIKGQCSCFQCFKTNTYHPTYHPTRFWSFSHFKDFTNREGFLLPEMIKDKYLKINKFEDELFLDINIIASFLLNKPLGAVSISKPYKRRTKATCNSAINVFADGSKRMSFSWDISFYVKTYWTPNIYKKWYSREKKWPPYHLINKDIHGKGYIIAKPSYLQKSNLSSVEFRYSFSHLERRLVSLHSKTQRLVYLIFKSFFYRWLKPLDPENISSYIAKTCFFWFCENHAPNELIWQNDDTHSVMKIIKTLFSDMSQAFDVGYLPYYFIPQINVIENIPLHSRKKIKEKLHTMLKNMSLYIPEKTKEVKYVLENWLVMFRDLLEKRDDVLYGIESVHTRKRIFYSDFVRTTH